MEKFNVTYRTNFGEVIISKEEYENMNSAVDAKSKMFDFDNIPAGYYGFTGEDGAVVLINPKCIESVRIIKISESEAEPVVKGE